MLAISIPWEISKDIVVQAILDPSTIHINPKNQQITTYWQGLNPSNGEAVGPTGVHTLPVEFYNAMRAAYEATFFQTLLNMGAVVCENGVKIAFDKATIIELPDPENKAEEQS